MSYRVQSPLDFSDTDSESETYWKRLSTCAQKSDTDCQESIERRRCNIWVKTANENILDEALSSAHIVTRSSDTSRHVENYFEYPASQGTPSNTSESKQLRRRVGSAKSRIQERHWNESIPRNHIGVTFDSPPDVVKKTLVRLLKEPNEELISQIVDVLGCKRALEFYFLTEDIEKIGGLYCADGTRRRSPGGVFLNLIKMSQRITDTEKKTMFALSRRIKDKLKRKRRKQRLESRKKLKGSEGNDITNNSHCEKSDRYSSMAVDALGSTNVAEEGEIMSTSESENVSQNDLM